jgi:hypothetical protein
VANLKGKNLLWLFVFSFTYLDCIKASAERIVDPKVFANQSKFSLNDTALITKSDFVLLTDEFFSGKTRALKILFSTDALTDEARTDILNNDGKGIRKKDHVFLVLFIDKDNKIWQVNLTFVIPGQTVVRTVAWKPEELKQFSSNYFYDGKRLKLQTKGNYKDANSEKAPINLTWDVNVDIPVFDKLDYKKR